MATARQRDKATRQPTHMHEANKPTSRQADKWQARTTQVHILTRTDSMHTSRIAIEQRYLTYVICYFALECHAMRPCYHLLACTMLLDMCLASYAWPPMVCQHG